MLSRKDSWKYFVRKGMRCSAFFVNRKIVFLFMGYLQRYGYDNVKRYISDEIRSKGFFRLIQVDDS